MGEIKLGISWETNFFYDFFFLFIIEHFIDWDTLLLPV